MHPMHNRTLTEGSMINRLCGLNKWYPQENDPERFFSCLQMNQTGRESERSIL